MMDFNLFEIISTSLFKTCLFRFTYFLFVYFIPVSYYDLIKKAEKFFLLSKNSIACYAYRFF